LTPAPVAARLEAGLDVAAFLFFPILVVAPRGLAPLAVAAGVVAAGLWAASPSHAPAVAVGPGAAVLACLLAWGICSALWSITPLRSLETAARLAAMFAAGLALAGAAGSVAAPWRLLRCFLAGLCLGIALTIADLATAGWVSAAFRHPYRETRLNQASLALAIVLLPAGAVLLRRRAGLALLLAGIGAATVYALAGTAAKTVLTAALPAAALFYCWHRRAARIAAVVSVLVIVTAPLTFARLERLPALFEMADAFKYSASHRLLIWSFAGDRIAEHPLLGWGLDASRAMPGGSDPIRAGQTWLPLHPHNAPLQLWLELGAPGAVLFALLAAHFWWRLAEREWPRLFGAAAGASLVIALLGSFGTYGVWQEWWLGTLALSLFLVLVMARADGLTPGRSPSGPGSG